MGEEKAFGSRSLEMRLMMSIIVIIIATSLSFVNWWHKIKQHFAIQIAFSRQIWLHSNM